MELQLARQWRSSILIRTKNEEKEIGHTLAAVFDQSVRPHEVIVIDSGSTDGTVEIAASFPVDLIHLDPSDWGYGRALNVAAASATGELLVCLSAHCRPTDRYWLRNLIRHFCDQRVAASWGDEVSPGEAFPRSIEVIKHSYTGGSIRYQAPPFSNANSCVRRKLWVELPFDESLPAAEDRAWAHEVMKRGYATVYDPEACVIHDFHTGISAIKRAYAIEAGLQGVADRSGVLIGQMRAPAVTLLRRRILDPLVKGDLRAIRAEVRRALPYGSYLVGRWMFLARRYAQCLAGRLQLSAMRSFARRTNSSTYAGAHPPEPTEVGVEGDGPASQACP